MSLMSAATIVTVLASIANPMPQAKEEGEQFGKQQKPNVFQHGEQIDVDVLIPQDQLGKPFDFRAAKAALLEQIPIHSDLTDFLNSPEVQNNERLNRGFSEDDDFFLQSELAASNVGDFFLAEPTQKPEDARLKRCLFTQGSQEITVKRTLNVSLEHIPAVYQEVKRCQGHADHCKRFTRRKAQDKVSRWEKQLRRDPTVSKHNVWLEELGAFSYHEIHAEWTHHDDAPECDHYQVTTKLVAPESWKETDHWMLDKEFEELAKSPDCFLIRQQCVEGPSAKTIHDRVVERPCWQEELLFVSNKSIAQSPCPYLNRPDCVLVGKNILQEEKGNVLWEYQFQCKDGIDNASDTVNTSIDGILAPYDDSDYSYEPNTSFAEITTKLAVFEDIKKQLESTNCADPRSIQLFKGQARTCRKSIADEITYDCCFSMKGLAATLKLKECTAEELHLADLRDRGMCHYVGSHSEKLVGVVKTRDTHVFCCFDSKLARVLQEQARPQLAIPWGTSKHPNCRGISHPEIVELDFTQVNLSELHEVPSELTKNMQQQIDSIETRVRQRLAEVNHDSL